MKDQRRCRNCQYLYTMLNGFGKCWDTRKTTDPNKRACRHHELGFPYIPRIKGKLAKVVKFDPSEEGSWIFYTSMTHALVVAWTSDVTGKKCWEVKLVGLKPGGGIHTKNFQTECPAFYGDITALGSGQNAIWTSYGYDDMDELDEDGVVKNKVRVVRMYPAEGRKPRKGGRKNARR